jgi:hypothetical protein
MRVMLRRAVRRIPSGQGRERPGAKLDAGPDVAGQARPRITGEQCVVRGFQGLFHRQDAEVLQQLGLAAVPAVQRAHAHAGALRDSRDRRARALGGKDIPRSIQHGQVIASGLRLPTVRRLRAE